MRVKPQCISSIKFYRKVNNMSREKPIEGLPSKGETASSRTGTQQATGPVAYSLSQINRRLSPLSLLAVITITTFSALILIVLLVEFYIEDTWNVPSHTVEAVIESLLYATTLTVVIFPVLYFFSFRPLGLYITERRQVEQQLRLQATALNAAANGIVITNHEGNIEWVNPAFVEMTGFTMDEVLGQKLGLLKSGEHETHFYQQLWQTILAGQVWYGEIINRRKDGSLYTEEQTIAPVWQENGEIAYFVAIKQDITARKLAQAQLEQQHKEIQRRLRETATMAAINQSLNETLELNRILQLIADSVPRLIPSVNRVVFHMLNEEDGLLWPVIWSGQPEYDAPEFHITLGEGVAERVIAEGKLVNLPDVQESPHGISYPPVSDSHSLMVAPLQSGERQQGTISVHSDAVNAFSAADERLLTRLADSAAVAIETARLYQAEHDQRQLAESLAKAAAALSSSLNHEEILETILEQTLQIVGGHYTAILLVKDNEAYLVRTRGDDEAIAVNLPESFFSMSADSPPSAVPPLPRMIETGKSVLIAETEANPNRSDHDDFAWLQSFAATPLLAGKQIIGFLNVYSKKSGFFNQRSIRRLEALAAHATLAIQNADLYNNLEAALQHEKTMRAQLIHAEKLAAMGRMVASVAHELNNPLQTIKNCIFLSQKRSSPDSEIYTYLGMALSETKRLSDLVLQLREVYRFGDSGSKQPLSIPKILDQVHLILNQHLKQHRVEWRQAAAGDFWVNGVSDQLKQVFLNICLNGVDAMQPDGGILSVALLMDQDSQHVGIEIRDSGPGIPPENIPQLFDPFFTTKDTGTGLGLAICYDIVQKHNGRITINNQPDQGAAFTIWLPSSKNSLEVQDVS
jgi:PAS domain S-box-containing protein